MKNRTRTHSDYLIPSLFLLSLALVSSCSSKTDSETKEKLRDTTFVTTSGVAQVGVDVPYEVVDDKAVLEGYYQLEHMKEWYPERVLPPDFDYGMDLSKKSAVELWLMRNEILARNGYLFDDAVLRGYFNQRKWYQPVFDVRDFNVQLNREEETFLKKVLKRENELMQQRYVRRGEYEMISADHIYNRVQFETVNSALTEKFAGNNFAIVPSDHFQLFHVYDKNQYEYVPNFITTDLYLQVLHKHFSSVLRGVEEEYYIPLMTTLLRDLHAESSRMVENVTDERMKNAATWANTYLAVAHTLVTGEVQSSGDPDLNEELTKIDAESGIGSEFLGFEFLNYSQFKPRGNYTKSEGLENYFRSIKWLNSGEIAIDDEKRFLGTVLIASYIKKQPLALKQFELFNGGISFIVGEEDNLSIANLMSLLSSDEAEDPSVFVKEEKLLELKEKLLNSRHDQIRAKGADDKTTAKLAAPKILFTAGRYTFDAEIMSRLTHVLKPDPLRPFPKGLDVFAALGNTTAKDILLKEYKESKQWPAYGDTLANVEKKFSSYGSWDKTIYTKTFELFTQIDRQPDNAPRFMKTPAWSKKNLNTSLAAYTELKHDMLLYAEQPYAAEAGEGGGPPPPTHYSYVEPNMMFWEKALDLLTFQEKNLGTMNLLTEQTGSIIAELKEIAAFLYNMSRKELNGTPLTKEEFEQLSYLGGRIEYLTFRIFDSDHLPEKEKHVAVVADVYNYNGVYLEEAVGAVDEIYVVVEINSRPYITRGAVFSYYEFTSPTPLTDEEWREKVTSGKLPARPIWMNEIVVKTPPLQSKPTFSF